MNKFRFTINLLAIAIFTLAFASMTQAQATRTWVSGVGDDANPCSRTAPCKTFAGAISKTAVDGEIDALDPAGYGAVTVTRSITIDGNGWGSILAAGTTAVIVNVGSSGSNFVQLRNISMNGAVTGINGVRIINGFAGATVAIENCVIFGFRSGTGRGVSDERTASGNLLVDNTLIKNNSGAGVAVVGTGGIKATINDSRTYKNGDGVVTSGGSNILAARNVVANSNIGSGFSAQAGSDMSLINCQSSFNATGVDSVTAGTQVRLARTQVERNTVNGLGFSGGTIQSYGNNEVSKNAGNNGPFSVGGTALF